MEEALNDQVDKRVRPVDVSQTATGHVCDVYINRMALVADTGIQGKRVGGVGVRHAIQKVAGSRSTGTAFEGCRASDNPRQYSEGMGCRPSRYAIYDQARGLCMALCTQ